MRTDPTQLRNPGYSLASDLSALHFEGDIVTGRHGLVSANLNSRQLFFLHHPGEFPFLTLELPPMADGPAPLGDALFHPAIIGWENDKGIDDLCALLTILKR